MLKLCCPRPPYDVDVDDNDDDGGVVTDDSRRPKEPNEKEIMLKKKNLFGKNDILTSDFEDSAPASECAKLNFLTTRNAPRSIKKFRAAF